jgi:hypothetical protein
MNRHLLAIGRILSVLILFSVTCVVGQDLNDVLITEIMCDPSPPVELPDVEYVELYNKSGRTISVNNWKLQMGSRIVILPDSVLPPDSYTILCHKNSLETLSGFGRVIGLSSFSLPNEGATLALYNHQNKLIYSVNYQDSWWPADKRSGGYALEMVDIHTPCLERENWEVSSHAQGGTPGRRNNVAGSRSDMYLPRIQHIEMPASHTVVVVFDKRLDSLGAVQGTDISVTGRSIIKRSVTGPSFQQLVLTLNAALLIGERYEVQLHNLPDCAGNLLREAVFFVGLPVPPDSGDVVINEILFEPLTGGVDFVEIYNRSAKFISLKGWALGNLKNGSTDVVRNVTTADVILSPNGFLALTTDAPQVAASYPTGQQRGFLEVLSMPSFPNEQGGVVLLDPHTRIHDRVAYSKSMHHPLLAQTKGVSLERVDPGKPAGENGNWHSAASSVGYATPGYANSQRLLTKWDDDFVVKPEVITPDLDGVDDYVSITYTQNFVGRIASVRIFDVNGRLINNLVKNHLIGTAGTIIWDGSDDRNQLVKTGYYLILIDTFDIHGAKQQFKKKVVVVSR